MNKQDQRNLFPALLLMFCMAFSVVVGQTPTTAPLQTGRGISLQYMDTGIKPCQDFYQYANGTWLTKTAIPADRPSWGAGAELYEKNLTLLHEILEDAAKDTNAPKNSPKRKVGDFYRSGMDEARIEADGAKPLAPEFARIEAIRDLPMLQEAIGHLHKLNVSAAFNFFGYQDFKNSSRIIAWFYQGGLGMPNRDYYTKEDEKSKEIRTKYVAHIAKMFELLGDKPEQAASEAKTVMEMETRLAKASMTPVEERDPSATYHKMTLAELSALTPGFTWDLYFKSIGLANPGDINVAQPEFYKEVGRMMTSLPSGDWKTYLRWQLINAEANRLSSAFVNENFNFNGKVIRGVSELQPRWKRILTSTDNSLGEALGQLFVERAFSPQAKAKAQVMIMNLKAALRDDLKVLGWISEATRQQALKKLDAIAVKVGYPDKWRDYSGLNIDGGSFVLNGMRADEFEFQRNLNKIGKPVDHKEWSMTPPTVDAYYNPNFNEIVFPAGILQPPFFDPQADDATNYGGVGAIIGHELTHGFDDQGRQFDAEGNLKNWWTAEDEKNYNSRASIVEAQYNEYMPLADMHINGKLTLGENIADLGGLKIAYLAFQKSLEGKPHPPSIDGFTPEQRFFLAFAQNWRRNTRPESVRVMLQGDPHSPPRFRVLGPLSNMPEFFQAFGCKAGDSGIRAENVQVKIW